MTATADALSFLLLYLNATSPSNQSAYSVSTAPAAASVDLAEGFDPSAPAWNTAWSEVEKQNQRDLGVQLAQNISRALQLNSTGWVSTSALNRLKMISALSIEIADDEGAFEDEERKYFIPGSAKLDFCIFACKVKHHTLVRQT